jgi:LPS O-antigen subunit length determinant protein (WzzB/FepE family)
LILALSIVLGGMVGVLAALIRSAIRNRRARLAS